MMRIRPLVEGDIPGVVDLRSKVYGLDLMDKADALRGYFLKVFLRNPWCDETLPSLVCEDHKNELIGFLGVIPRPMSANGRRIHAAVCTHFMVEPSSRRSLAALQMQKAFLAGPQDLSLADEANDASRKLWEMCGGTTSILNSLRWTYILRPSLYLKSVLIKRNALGLLWQAADSILDLIDTIAMRVVQRNQSPDVSGLVEEDANPVDLLDGFSRFYRDYSVHPIYRHDALVWLLETVANRGSSGSLRKVLLRNAEKKVVGWFLYYLRPGGVAQVLHLGAADHEDVGVVLDRLFQRARREGAIAVSGRLVPRWVPVFSDKFCLIHRSYHWMLMHSRDREILYAIQSGDASLTRLDGEWWMDFEGAS